METNSLRECLLCRTAVVRKGLKEHLAQVHGVNLEDAQQFILQVNLKLILFTAFISTMKRVPFEGGALADILMQYLIYALLNSALSRLWGRGSNTHFYNN